VREGNTARVTRNIPAIDQGKMPILFNMSRGLSIVVRSLSISTLASAGIRTALSFGVILFKNKKMTRVIPVSAAEHAKKIPLEIALEDAEDTERIDTIGGAIPERP